MARPGKASNGIGAGHARITAGRFSWSMPTLVKRLTSSAKSWIWPWNASGIRDTARVLHVSPATVLKELKKKSLTSSKCIRQS